MTRPSDSLDAWRRTRTARNIRRAAISAAAAAVSATLLLSAPSAFAAASIRALIAATPTGQIVHVGSGTYDFSDFDANHVGLSLSGKAGLVGAGVTSTVLQMTPYSSTRRSSVPTSIPSTNPLYLMAVGGTPTLSSFTLQGTSQGHLYNGLQLVRTRSARVTNVKVAAIPGNDHVPPGETFGINDYRTTGSQYTNVEVNGAGVGASGFAANYSTGLSINNGYFHDNRYCAGLAVYRSSNVTLTDVRSINNRAGLSLEQDSGTITLVRPTIQVPAGSGGFDFFIGSYTSGAKISIYDPVLPAGGKLRILLQKTYGGKPNGESRGDVHVYVGGVDKTASLVTWYN